MTRLGFDDAGAELLSYGEFHDLYREYQKVFDLENMLRAGKTTYEDLKTRRDTETIINF